MMITKINKFSEISGFELGYGVFNNTTINGRISTEFKDDYISNVVTFLNEYETKFSPRFGRTAHANNVASAFLYSYLTEVTTTTECLIHLRRTKTVVTAPVYNVKLMSLIAKRVNISTNASGRVIADTHHNGHLAAFNYFTSITFADVDFLKSNTYFRDCIKSKEDTSRFLDAVNSFISSVLILESDGTITVDYVAAFNIIEKATQSLNVKWETTSFVADEVDSNSLGIYRFRGDSTSYRADKLGLDSLSKDTLSCYLSFLKLHSPKFLISKGGQFVCTSLDNAVPGDVFFYPDELALSTVWKIVFSFYTIDVPRRRDEPKSLRRRDNGAGSNVGVGALLGNKKDADPQGALRTFSALSCERVETLIVCGYTARKYYVGDKIMLLPASIYSLFDNIE